SEIPSLASKAGFARRTADGGCPHITFIRHRCIIPATLQERHSMPATRLLPIFTVCLLTLTTAIPTTFTLSALAENPSLAKPPETPQHAVTDEYQGVKVTDEYRWLENWDDPAVKQWSAAENARTREYLDQVPARTAIKNRLRQLVSARSVTYSA